jgi:hypothetical protein
MGDTLPGAEYDKDKTRPGYAVVTAVDPHDGGTWNVLISPKLLEWVKRNGMGRTRELTDSVRWSLLNPSAVYRGVRDLEREIDDDGWLCYVATPPRAYDYRTGNARRPWEGEVLMVCVTDERELYGWWWVEADPDDARLPIGHQQRFREKVF